MGQVYWITFARRVPDQAKANTLTVCAGRAGVVGKSQRCVSSVRAPVTRLRHWHDTRISHVAVRVCLCIRSGGRLVMWVLVLLIPLGEPHAFKFEVLAHADTYTRCLQLLDAYEYEHPDEKLGCGEIE